MRIPLVILASLLVACGPTAAEQQAAADMAKARKDCGRTYSSSEKVLQDALYSRGVAEVKFADRNDYIQKCVDLSLSASELKCVDPNLAEGEACKALPDDSKKKVTELQKFMMGPMRKDGGETKAADAKPADAKPAGEGSGEAAGGATPAADGAAPEGGGEAAPE